MKIKNKNENKIQVKQLLTLLQKILNEIKKKNNDETTISYIKFK